jgi:FAT domain
VADPTEDLDSWLELVTLCRKENMFSLCENLLRQLGAPIPVKATACTSLHSLSRDSHAHNVSRDSQALQNMSAQGSTSMIAVSSSLPNMLLPATLSMTSMTPSKVNPLVVLATHKYWWCSGEKVKALASLTEYIASLESASAALTANKDTYGISAKSDASATTNIFSGTHLTARYAGQNFENIHYLIC